MAPLIRRLLVKRFRSFVLSTIDFDNPTFLVGRNGAGKSNLVDALKFLSECVMAPLSAVFELRGGIEAVRNRSSGPSSHPPNLVLGVEIGPMAGAEGGSRYVFEVKAVTGHRFLVRREQCRVDAEDGSFWFDRTATSLRTNVELKPALDPSSLALPLVGGHAKFAPLLRALSSIRVHSIEPAKLREPQDPDSGTTLRPDGANAASVLRELAAHGNGAMSSVNELLAAVVPSTVAVRHVKHGKKLSIEFTQEIAKKKRLRFEAFNMSDGTLRALGLILALQQRPAPSLVAIEEPEATIHPGAMGAILDLIRSGAKQTQVVVTTHSPDVLDAKWIEARNLRIVDWAAGETRVGAVSEAVRGAMRDHLMGAGELMRANALDTDAEFFEDDTLGQGGLFEAVP